MACCDLRKHTAWWSLLEFRSGRDQMKTEQKTPESTNAYSGVVQVAKEGFGKGGDTYDKYRPTYQDKAIDFILKHVNLSSNFCDDLRYDVVELGAGTGKFTESFVSKLSKSTRYLATDPSRNFLDVLEAKCLQVFTVVGSASAIPLPDSSVQTIVCAQCFHWFANEESLQEMRRVLVPGGKLILIWNAKQYNKGWMTEFYKQRMKVIERVGGSLSNFYHTLQWHETMDSSLTFSLVEHVSLPGTEIKGNLDHIMAHINTISTYSLLPEAERLAYLDALKKAIWADPDVDVEAMVVSHSCEIYVYAVEKI